MSQTLHQIYQGKAFVLTKTMVTKFHKIAEAVNVDLINRGYSVDVDHPETWKYYLNMFGVYHQADKDRIRELTNGEFDHIRIKVAGETGPVEVNFTKENLFGTNGDIAVANEYRFNTYYYNSLVEKYPEFEELILGVLNPIHPDISTTAQEGEILYCGGYSKTLLTSGIYHFVRQDYGPISENFLIESNEENLIPILQEYIYNFLERWWNANYAVTSNLFHTTFIALLYLSIPQILGNIRLGNAKTPMAHSFHIREHLESWGNLGWVAEYLSKGVLLWLYRNMVWLTANRGKEKVMQDIIENVLTPTKIPIAGYRARHDIEELAESSLYADIFLERTKLNFNNGSTATRTEVLDIIEAEASLATFNSYDQEGQVVTTKDRFKYSMFDDLGTCVLESTVIDDSNKIPVTLEDIALNLWCYTASSGQYRGTVIFTNPVNNDRMQLTPLNAYILAFYCFNKGWANVEFDEIPTMYARQVHASLSERPSDKHPFKPRLADVSKGVVKPFITDEEIVDILGTYNPTYRHGSSTSFAKEVVLAHKEALRKYYRYARIEDAQGRGYGEWVAHKCYWYDIECPLTKEPTKFSDWLALQGLQIEDYSRQDLVALGLNIVEAAVGVDLNTSEELRNRQTAALAILKHFASYTVQIIQNTVASESYWLNWKGTRLTNFKSKATGSLQAQLPMYTARDTWSIKDGPIWLSIFVNKYVYLKKEKLVSHDVLPLSDFSISKMKAKDASRYKLPSWTIVNMTIPDIVDTRNNRVYSYLTTSMYPIGEKETLAVKVNLANQIQISLPKLRFKEGVSLNATLDMILNSPSVLDAKEQLTVSPTFGSMEINSGMTDGGERLAAHATLGNQIVLAPSVLTVREGIDVNVTGTGDATIAPVNARDVESLGVSATMVGAISILPPKLPLDETLETFAYVPETDIEFAEESGGENLAVSATIVSIVIDPNT